MCHTAPAYSYTPKSPQEKCTFFLFSSAGNFKGVGRGRVSGRTGNGAVEVMLSRAVIMLEHMRQCIRLLLAMWCYQMVRFPGVGIFVQV